MKEGNFNQERNFNQEKLRRAGWPQETETTLYYPTASWAPQTQPCQGGLPTEPSELLPEH